MTDSFKLKYHLHFECLTLIDSYANVLLLILCAVIPEEHQIFDCLLEMNTLLGDQSPRPPFLEPLYRGTSLPSHRPSLNEDADDE